MISHASKVLLKIIQERIREGEGRVRVGCNPSGFQGRERNSRSPVQPPQHDREGKSPSKTALPVFRLFRESLQHSQSQKALEDVGRDGDGFRKTSGRVDAVIV